MRQNTVQPGDQSKPVLRRQLRSRRSKLSNSQRATYDAAIGQSVLELVKNRNAASIACYWPFDGEPFRDLAAPMRVGVAYGLQEIEPISRNKWDVPLHAVVNENGWFTFADHDF